MSAELESLKQWIGRTETAIDYVTVPSVNRLSATLDRDDVFPKMGEPLPVGWHSILFPRVVRHSQIGADGHPARGDFLPPVPLPRRMFAGKRTTFIAPLHIGDEVHRESTIQNVTVKDGRSGRMVFVTVKTDIRNANGVAITEEQDIVYLAIPKAYAPPPPSPAPRAPDWSVALPMDPVLLFRFSALTFNSHRIHYDRTYAQSVEQYPGLVVHGPLQAMALFEAARARGNGRQPAQFSFRGQRPLFDHDTITINGRTEGDNWALYTANGEGSVAMAATLSWR